MHPETKKINAKKNMPYPNLTENLKLQPGPGLVASYDIQPGNGVGLFWDKHTHTFTYLLTCPGPTYIANHYQQIRLYNPKSLQPFAKTTSKDGTVWC